MVGIKAFVDMFLFFVSYKVQHKYIFKDDRKKKEDEKLVKEEQIRLQQALSEDEEAETEAQVEARMQNES